MTHAPLHWTIPASPDTVRVLINGYQSWSEAELRPLTDTPPPRALPVDD